MSPTVNRRHFVLQSTALAAGAAWLQHAALGAEAPANQVVVGVMGLSRGRALADSFAKQPGVVVKYVCDVDSTRAESCAKLIQGATGKGASPITDFRQILDDKEVDALICAAPNHWHAPATILGCAAGKHVYVEKPCSHNPREGELMVEAARKHRRAVQMGSQRRSGPGTIEAMQKLHEGRIGRVYLARSWYTNQRGSIGQEKPEAPPSHLNYELWQGPAPRKPYQKNVVHYNWHWFWHWGNGELGNNGVHTIDLCRWGLDVHYPIQVTSSGGRYHFQDDQQTPDTHTVCFDFDGRKSLVWEGRSCNKHRAPFVEFYGTEGSLELAANGSHVIFDKNEKEVEKSGSSSAGDLEHIANFLAAIRNDKPLELNAEIEKGHQSTLLCHLGNIAHRTGRTLHCDPKNGHIVNDEEAMKLWARDYAPGWEPQV
jgi:predicted dehydrogenase